MKRRFQEVNEFGDDGVQDRPRMRGTGFTDQELESRFGGSSTGNGGCTGSTEQLFDEETMRRIMRQQRAQEEAAARAAALGSAAPPVQATSSHDSRTQSNDMGSFSEMPASTPQSLGPSDFRDDAAAFPPLPPSASASGTSQAGPSSTWQSSAGTSSTGSSNLAQGDLVLVKGLKAAAHLNGQRGRLGPLDFNTGRWEVTILSSGDVKAIKPDNLEPETRDKPREDVAAEEMFVVPRSPDQAPAPSSPKGSTSAGGSARPAGAAVASLSSGAFVVAGSVTESTKSPAPPSAEKEKPRKTTRRQGTVRWYNGRRKIGKVIPDNNPGSDLFIPAQGALNGSQVPPQPGGLFHGTRVSFMPVEIKPSDSEKMAGARKGQIVCMDVRPLPGQVGLTVGVDTNIGAKEKNDDRLAACDLHELGFLAAVFDGHRGPVCAEYMAKELPKLIHSTYRASVKRQPGASVLKLSSTQEANLISAAMSEAFEAADKAFLVTARKKDIHDGSTAVVALVTHGFEAQAPPPGNAEVGAEGLWAKVAKKLGQEEPGREADAEHVPQRTPGTVPRAPGGVAKLFLAWIGDSRAVLIRGRQGLRCTEDHRPSRKDELARIQKAGGFVGRDAHGVWRVGPKEESRFAKELQRGRKSDSHLTRWFLATSRAFGDIELKAPDPILVATPEVKVLDLVPEDWACVLCSDGVTDVLSDQQVANVIFKAMAVQGKDPVAASKALVQTALGAGARDNLTAIVMRFGWATPPRADAAMPGEAGTGGSGEDGGSSGGFDMFG